MKPFASNRDYAEAYHYRGIAFDDIDEYDLAIEDYNYAIRLRPDHVSTFRDRGISYENKGDLKKANEDYQSYIELGGSEADKVRGWIENNKRRMSS